jgi:hypothetical protein
MKIPLGPANKPLVRKDIEAVLIEQELFLQDYSNKDSGLHCLNNGAAVIWLLCDGTRDVESIAGEIATTFRLPRQQVLTEVQETVTQFQTLGLLERA